MVKESYNLNDSKEQFSYAYVWAVASVAGYVCGHPTRMEDNLGIDLVVRKRSKGKGKLRNALDIQVKCCAENVVTMKEKELIYDLDVGNYIELIKEDSIPQLLVLVVVPVSIEDWISQSEEELIIRKCAYYKKFDSSDKETDNKSTIRISIPRDDVFTPGFLRSFLK